MESLKNKNILITGATSGIGRACAYLFAKKGCNLILIARREKILSEMSLDLTKKYKIDCTFYKLDITNKKDVKKISTKILEENTIIDILINNAGLAKGLDSIQEANIDDWEIMINTNIKGLLYITREILPSMIENNSGHIINIGSIAGHEVYPKGSVYCATKFAVNALTQGIRIDVLGTQVRVSTIDPGAVKTEFSLVRFDGDKDRADKVYHGIKPLTGDDIAEAALWIANRPQHVSIHEIIIMPSVQATATRVFRIKP